MRNIQTVIEREKPLMKTIKKCLKNRQYFNMLKNIAMLKQCNYIKCNRKDLDKYKVCKRCKSAFYCCRNHQKKDWNTSHRVHCVQRKRRDILLQTFDSNVNPFVERITTQFLNMI